MAKSIKIPNEAHRELKIFVAQNDTENMTALAGVAIMKELKERGHKFSTPTKSNKPQKTSK